jgi:hypothetical protein
MHTLKPFVCVCVCVREREFHLQRLLCHAYIFVLSLVLKAASTAGEIVTSLMFFTFLFLLSHPLIIIQQS